MMQVPRGTKIVEGGLVVEEGFRKLWTSSKRVSCGLSRRRAPSSAWI
jgi:hypothetical protein